jgi:hypothetical protein
METERLKIAVRVLNAFCACVFPHIKDVIALREMAVAIIATLTPVEAIDLPERQHSRARQIRCFLAQRSRSR